MRNTLKTAILLAALGGLLILVGGGVFGGAGAAIGLVLGLVIVGGSYWFSDAIALRAARARPVSEAEAPRLHAVVRELATRADLPMPRVYVTPDQQANAFATGRSPAKAAVAVTEGLLRTLDERELRGVLAHELMHVRHRDILIGSVAAAVAMAIMFVARMAMFGALFGGGRDREGGNAFGALALALLAPVAAMLVQMSVSRTREYAADEEAARLIGDGEPLARALERLHASASRVPMDVNPALENAYIVSPLSAGARQRGNVARLFSTHPPAEERVARLRAMRFDGLPTGARLFR